MAAIAAATIVATAVMAAIAVMGLTSDSPVTISVINQTDRTLARVLVSIEGRQCRAGEIYPGGRASWRHLIRNESDAVLSFDDGKGGRFTKADNAYMCGGMRGELELIVAPEGVRIGRRPSL